MLNIANMQYTEIKGTKIGIHLGAPAKGRKQKLSKTGREMAQKFGILPPKRKMPNLYVTKGMKHI